tara:strand:+ start:96 stop:401 length:306 start_codon:yes stop_codon:yes gene_type:complete
MKEHDCYKLSECELNKTYVMCQSNWTGKCPNGCELNREESLREEILEHLFFMGFGANTPFRVLSSHADGVVLQSVNEQNKIKITYVEANKLYAELTEALPS